MILKLQPQMTDWKSSTCLDEVRWIEGNKREDGVGGGIRVEEAEAPAENFPGGGANMNIYIYT